MTSYFVLAAINPGVNIGNWVQTNIAGLFVGIVAVLGIGLLITRHLMKALLAFVFAGIAAVFVFGGTSFAQKLSSLILSWFN